MARFTVDPSRLNFNVERKGKEYNLRVLQRAQAIFSTLLSLLPSNYTSTIQGPNYTTELKVVAVELAKIELALEDVNLDLDYKRTRSEFLYGIVGYLCFLNNRLPSFEFSDTEFRQFLLSLIRIYFQGSIPKSMKEAVGLFLTTEFRILENFLLVREGTAGLDISDQFGFQIDVATGNEFPAGIFDLQSSIRIILDIIRPAHTLFSVRFIFQDEYEPNEDGLGRILDSMHWKLSSYHYEDYRKYWSGLRDRDRLGARQCHSVVGESHVTAQSLARGVLQVGFTSTGVLESLYEVTGGLASSFTASGDMTAGYSPLALSALVGWLRVADATVEGSGVSVLPDVANPGKAATQSLDLHRPPLGVSGNGLPILQFGGDAYMVHSLEAAINNNADYLGIALWLRSPPSSAARAIYAIRSAAGGASAHRMTWQIPSDETALVDLHIDNSNGRRLRTNAAEVTGDWEFWTLEFEGALLGDARCLQRKNGTQPLSTYSAFGTATEMPATLVTPTGFAFLGATTIVPSSPFVGDMGPNIYFLNRQLTGGELTDLMAYDAPA